MFDSLIVRNTSLSGSSRDVLSMNGRDIFNFTVQNIPKEISSVCEINGINENDIDHFVLHQASKFVVSAIANKTQCEDKSKFVNYIDLFGNTVSSSIPIALSKLFSENSNLGKNLLISGFGVGLSCGSTVLFNKGEFKNE